MKTKTNVRSKPDPRLISYVGPGMPKRRKKVKKVSCENCKYVKRIKIEDEVRYYCSLPKSLVGHDILKNEVCGVYKKKWWKFWIDRETRVGLLFFNLTLTEFLIIILLINIIFGISLYLAAR